MNVERCALVDTNEPSLRTGHTVVATGEIQSALYFNSFSHEQSEKRLNVMSLRPVECFEAFGVLGKTTRGLNLSQYRNKAVFGTLAFHRCARVFCAKRERVSCVFIMDELHCF